MFNFDAEFTTRQAWLGRIRQLVGTNLTLGFLTLASGTVLEFLGDGGFAGEGHFALQTKADVRLQFEHVTYLPSD